MKFSIKWFLIGIAIPLGVFAQNTINDQTDLPTPAAGDELLIWDIDGTVGQRTKKATVANIIGNNGASITMGGDVSGTADAVTLDADTVDSAEIVTDAVGLDELDDDANSPAAGDFIIVETGTASVDYITPNAGTDVTADLEEETHAAEHAENAADEILGENLGTACALNEIWKSDGAGGVACAADSGGGATIDVEEDDVSVEAAATNLDFGLGFDVTSSPAGEANVVLDLTEDQVNLATEVTGVLPDANVADDITLTNINQITTRDHDLLGGLADDDHTQYSLLSSGAGAPSSTPGRVGEIYTDTTDDRSYLAVGTASSADWRMIDGFGGNRTITVDPHGGGDVTTISAAITAVGTLSPVPSVTEPAVIRLSPGEHATDPFSVPAFTSVEGPPASVYGTLGNGALITLSSGFNLSDNPTHGQFITLPANAGLVNVDVATTTGDSNSITTNSTAILTTGTSYLNNVEILHRGGPGGTSGIASCIKATSGVTFIVGAGSFCASFANTSTSNLSEIYAYRMTGAGVISVNGGKIGGLAGAARAISAEGTGTSAIAYLRVGNAVGAEFTTDLFVDTGATVRINNTPLVNITNNGTINDWHDDLTTVSHIADGDWGDFTITTNAAALDADVVDSVEVVTDAIGTDELDDDANTPVAGNLVIVETGAASFDYIAQNAGTDVTADLEEETHAAEHAENAADELLGENLGTACAINEVMKSDGAGGLDCAADVSGGGGTANILDLADDASNESADLVEIATTGDTNSIFTEPAADKLLIDMGQNWPTADTANAGDSATAFFSAGEIESARIAATLTGKTLTTATLTQPALTLTQSATPTPTAEGIVEWDTDDNQFKAGDGAATLTFSDDTVVQARANHTGTQTMSTISDAGALATLSSVSSAEIDASTIVAADVDLTSNWTWTGEHDFSGGGIEIENGTTPPACTEGQVYMDTDATSGQRLMACEGGTFVTQGDGGGAETNDLEAADPPTILDTEIYIGTGAGTGAFAAISGDATMANTGALTIAANSVALSTDTTGSYAAGDAEAGAALTGDSATSFFSTGTIEDARLPGSMADKTITGALTIPQGASPTVDAAGELAFDTTAVPATGGEGQLVVHDGSSGALSIPVVQQECATIENLAAGDDGYIVWTPMYAVTIVAATCGYDGSAPTLAATVDLEDGAGNDMTMTDITCGDAAAALTGAAIQAVTAANTLTAYESLGFNVTNAVNPETDKYTICWAYTVTTQ